MAHLNKQRYRRRFLLLFIVALALALSTWVITSAASPLTVDSFVVDDPGNNPDDVSDCVCLTAGGVCTLSAAIVEANYCPGGQIITFAAPYYISPVFPLPTLLDDATTIDGSNRWMMAASPPIPGVVLDGEGRDFAGISIASSYNAIYGLQISNFGREGIRLITGAQNNKIGGTGFHQRNVISGNGKSGIKLQDISVISNTVVNNYIGTNPAGIAGMYAGTEWGNAEHGIAIHQANDNLILGNLISDNGWSGVGVDLSSGIDIHGNVLGADIYGAPLGNQYYGVHIASNSVATVSSNKIAHNKRGIQVEANCDPRIISNDIYSNTANLLTFPVGGGILLNSVGSETEVWDNAIMSNTAQLGGGLAIISTPSLTVQDNLIQANHAVTSTTSPASGGGVYVYNSTVILEENQVFSNTVSSAGLARGGGVFLNTGGNTVLEANEIQGNQVSGASGGGGGLSLAGPGLVTIERNRITHNQPDLPSLPGSALYIDTGVTGVKTWIESNWIGYNGSGIDAAIYLSNTEYVTLTNNVLAHNAGAGLCLDDTGSYIRSIHNTIANNAGSGIILPDSSLYLFNNILAFNQGYALEVEGAWSLDSTRNDVWGNLLGVSNVAMSIYMQSDPLFHDAAGGHYALLPSSPCLDDCDTSHTTATSINGVSRPQGSSCDMGAFEMLPPLFLPLIRR